MEKELLNVAFKLMLNHSTDMIFIKDTDLVYRAASIPFVKMVGKDSTDEIIGRTDVEIFSEIRLANRYERDDREILASGTDLINFVEPITYVEGRPRYGMTSKYLLRNEQNQVIGIMGVTRDITREYRARQHYQQELRYLFELPEDTLAVCYIDIDAWRIIKQRRQHISTGNIQECHTVDQMCKYAVQSIVNQKNDAVKFYQNFTPAKLWEIYTSGRSRLAFEYERKLTDGSTRWVHNEIHFLTDVDSGHLCVMLSDKDINENKQEQQKIMSAAQLDQMTKVLNRETAMEYIRNHLQQENDKQHALMMLDIDNFKSLNDTLGHQAGDQFLIGLAGELKTAFQDKGIVGRIGGDEFFVFLENVSELNEIENYAKEILDIVSDVARGYLQINLSGSVGVGLYPENGNALEALYAKADEALYIAKKSGKNQYIFAE